MNMLTQKEAAEIIGVTRRTLYRWRKRGIGPPCKKIGNTVRYPEQKFWEWADESERDVEESRQSTR